MTNPVTVPRQWHGLWRSVGYNRMLEIDAHGYAAYSVTRGFACLAERGSAGQFQVAFDRVNVDAFGRLNLFHAHDVTRYTFERRATWDGDRRVFLDHCDDPLSNLAAFCEVFAENYAFFGLHGVDWGAQCTAARKALGTSTTTAELLDSMARMIAPLADLHVYISTPERKVRPAHKPRGPRQALRATFALPTLRLSARSTTEGIASRIRHTLLTDYGGTLGGFRQAGNEVVCWCTLSPGVGYLCLLRMFGFAATAAARGADDLPHPLHEVGPFMGADMAALARILDEAMRDLSPHKTLIIDARLNAGGFDRAGLMLCERLLGEPRTVYRKKARLGQGFTEPQHMTLTPSPGPRFQGRVFLLTSVFTQSAGEVLALAASALPSVTVLGEPTLGILSDNLFHRLPSGWEVSLSNEVYENPAGSCFEGSGVPPDEPLPPLRADTLLLDLREGLRRAVARASND